MSTVLSRAIALTALAMCHGAANAADYVIDTAKAHAFIQFKISHLGYSWLLGRFNDFEGTFSFDENKPDTSSVEVRINPASVDTNHAERDKHLRSEDFLYVEKYPQASFKSTAITMDGSDQVKVKGDLTLRGVTRPITIDAKRIGGGSDPWGGYRQGFEGRTEFALKDYGIPKDLGPASEKVELFLSIEGIRK